VISSRSFVSAPSAYSAGATEVIAIRFPQCGQGEETRQMRWGNVLIAHWSSPSSETSQRGHSPTDSRKSQEIFVRCTMFVHRGMTGLASDQFLPLQGHWPCVGPNPLPLWGWAFAPPQSAGCSRQAQPAINVADFGREAGPPWLY
jgi:hypothetical protein